MMINPWILMDLGYIVYHRILLFEHHLSTVGLPTFPPPSSLPESDKASPVGVLNLPPKQRSKNINGYQWQTSMCQAEESEEYDISPLAYLSLSCLSLGISWNQNPQAVSTATLPADASRASSCGWSIRDLGVS